MLFQNIIKPEKAKKKAAHHLLGEMFVSILTEVVQNVVANIHQRDEADPKRALCESVAVIGGAFELKFIQTENLLFPGIDLTSAFEPWSEERNRPRLSKNSSFDYEQL